jgi:hypothetical protein
VIKEDLIELAATLEKSSNDRLRIWFRLPSAFLPALPRNLDSFVVAVLFNAMSASADLEIHGEVSRSLLYNLAEFQRAWALWLPQKYHPVEFFSETERDQPRVDKNESILAFSGGVDSTFSAWRHRPDPDDPHQKKLAAGIMIHGFDIPINQPEVFSRAAEKSRIMLASIGVNLIPVSTNLREQQCSWEDSHGTAIAACLMLFQAQYNTGLIASSYPYNKLIIPWGSNPLTDPLLTNESFRMVHDGSAFSRVEKMRRIVEWPEAMLYLRVCWEGRSKDHNCCRCQKCVSTMLNFKALGYESIPAFPYNISDREICHLKYSDTASLQSTSRVIKMLKTLDFPTSSTLRALRVSVIVNHIWHATWKFSLAKKPIKLFERWWFLNPDLARESKG